MWRWAISDPARISKLGADGKHLSGDAPTKEAMLHLAMYRERPNAAGRGASHSTHSVAVSALANIDPNDVLPPITAYYVMRVGRLPLIPYFPPGDQGWAEAVGKQAAKHHAVLLANHGRLWPVARSKPPRGPFEELEETAKLYLMLQRPSHPLSDARTGRGTCASATPVEGIPDLMAMPPSKPKLAANLSMIFPRSGSWIVLRPAASVGFRAVEFLFPYAYAKQEIVRGSTAGVSIRCCSMRRKAISRTANAALRDCRA